jgi:hypothetical protein
MYLSRNVVFALQTPAVIRSPSRRSLARNVLTHVNTPKGAGVEAEWLVAIYVKMGAVAGRIISHQGEEVF